jgi:hypothetical protein
MPFIDNYLILVIKIASCLLVFTCVLFLSSGSRADDQDGSFGPGFENSVEVGHQPPGISGERKSSQAAPRLTVQPYKQQFSYPEPIVITAWLSGSRPIGKARVTATITSPSGRRYQRNVLENILYGTIMPGPGTYILLFTDVNEDGLFEIAIRADDGEGRAEYYEPFTSEAADVQPGKAITHSLSHFQLTQTVTVSGQHYGQSRKLPPLRVWDLYARFETEPCLTLSWTVPQNIGSRGTFDIRYAKEPILSETVWQKAVSADKGGYTEEGGERVNRSICHLPSGMFHFVVRSYDESGMKSELSNDYVVVNQ